MRLWRALSRILSGRSFCRGAAAPTGAARAAVERCHQAALRPFPCAPPLAARRPARAGARLVRGHDRRVAADHDGKTYSGAYETTQAISAQVHRETDLDGIQYRSRFDSDELCVALFDRADAAIELVDEGGAIERAWVESILEPRGRYLVEL